MVSLRRVALYFPSFALFGCLLLSPFSSTYLSYWFLSSPLLSPWLVWPAFHTPEMAPTHPHWIVSIPKPVRVIWTPLGFLDRKPQPLTETHVSITSFNRWVIRPCCCFPYSRGAGQVRDLVLVLFSSCEAVIGPRLCLELGSPRGGHSLLHHLLNSVSAFVSLFLTCGGHIYV